MKKILMLLIGVFCAFLLTGCGKEDKITMINKLDKKINGLKGYQLEATMELINNNDSYKYDVLVSYQKDDNYRVSLKNQTNNHEQIILKNNDGVYVLTPSLNKSFKFQSKWPYNNSQAYLLQSIINDLKSDSKVDMKEISNGYVFTSKVNYKNNASLVKQEVIVDKKMNFKKVIVYDKNDVAQITVVFSQVDLKAKFKDNYFALDENMKASVEDDEEQIKQETSMLDETVYPMYLPEGTYLENEKTVELDEGSRVILTFAGENPFILVEETALPQDDTVIVPTAGDLDMLSDTIAIIGESSVSWISDSVEYYLVSSTLSQSELIEVAKSVTTLPVSK